MASKEAIFLAISRRTLTALSAVLTIGRLANVHHSFE